MGAWRNPVRLARARPRPRGLAPPDLPTRDDHGEVTPLGAAPSGLTPRPGAAWLRRRGVIERVIAAFLLAVFSPLVGALAWAIRREDGGPAFIALERIGRYGRPFPMWKLRTMTADSADGRAAGPVITVAGDPRVTRIGRVLRRHRMDELPQLWNVVRGDMALIGPRPETPEYVDLSDGRWGVPLSVRPGIAGSTQVVVHEWETAVMSAAELTDPYRDVVLDLKLELDAWYVNHARAAVDADIVVSLAQQFVLGVDTTRIQRRIARTGGRIPEVDSGLPPPADLAAASS